MVRSATTWEVLIPVDRPDHPDDTLRVEAGNWMEALKVALTEHGDNSPTASDLMLDIKGPEIRVTDVKQRCVYKLRQVDASSAADGPSTQRADQEPNDHNGSYTPPEPPPDLKKRAESSPQPQSGRPGSSRQARPSRGRPKSKKNRTSPVDRSPTLAHEVFFLKDEDPGPKIRLTYRERLVAVRPGTSAEDAKKLLLSLFDSIKESIKTAPRGQYINITIFDHIFTDRAERPAIAALDWKDWRGRDPSISFPIEAPTPEQPVIPRHALKREQEHKREQDVKNKLAEETRKRKEEEKKRKELEELKLLEEEEKKRKELEELKLLQEEEEKKRKELEELELLEEEEKKRKEIEELEILEEEEKKRKEIEAIRQKESAEQKQKEEGLQKKSKKIVEGKKKDNLIKSAKKDGLEKALDVAPEIIDFDDIIFEVWDAMQGLYSITTRKEAVKFGVDLIAEKIPCQTVVGFSKIRGNPHEMSCTVINGDADEALLGQNIVLNGTMLGKAVHIGLAVAYSNVLGDSRIDPERDHLVKEDTKSVMCVPFFYEGRNFGAAELLNRQGGDTWREREIHLVTYIGSQIAQYIAESIPSEDDNFEADFAELENVDKKVPTKSEDKTSTHPQPQTTNKVSPKIRKKKKKS